MQLSLSVRIAEEFMSKEKASMPLDDLARLAKFLWLRGALHAGVTGGREIAAGSR
ncbi:MAG: hypothetical protein CM1200mP29_05570 [Verrucomicrobiota bacterium]|nr:MAG: hypothetical protein CM1200mP29_05570 [Verrucomicrobiota bacterium]